jgi:hypothetical protein
MLGNSQTGKSGLCTQWSGGLPSTSYMTTIEIESHFFDGLTILDTPSSARVHFNVDKLCKRTHLFILVSNIDESHYEWYDRIGVDYPDIPFLLILNGSQTFPKSRLWALSNDIRVFQVDLKIGHRISESMDYLVEMLSSIEPSSDSVDLTAGYLGFVTFPFLDVLYSSCV